MAQQFHFDAFAIVVTRHSTRMTWDKRHVKRETRGWKLFIKRQNERTASAVETIQLGNCRVSGIADSADFSRDCERERRKEKKRKAGRRIRSRVF